MKKILFIILGILIGTGITAFANNFTWNSPENLQTGKNVIKDGGRDVPQIQIWCDMRYFLDKEWTSYCKWSSELQRWKLTCLGLERLFSADIKGDKNGNYKCVELLKEE